MTQNCFSYMTITAKTDVFCMWYRAIYRDVRAASPGEMSVHF